MLQILNLAKDSQMYIQLYPQAQSQRLYNN